MLFKTNSVCMITAVSMRSIIFQHTNHSQNQSTIETLYLLLLLISSRLYYVEN